MKINPNMVTAYQTNTQAAVKPKAVQENTKQAEKIEPNLSTDNKVVKFDIEKKAQALKASALDIVKHYAADRKAAITSLSNSLRLFEKHQAKYGNAFDIYMQDGVIKISSDKIDDAKKAQLESEINQDKELVDAFNQLHDATLNIYNAQVKLRHLTYSYKDKKTQISYPKDDTLREKKDLEGKLKLIRAGQKFIEYSPDGVQKLNTSLLNKVEKAHAFSQAHSREARNMAAQYHDFKERSFLYEYHSAVVEFDNVTHDIARSLGVEGVTVKSLNINAAMNIYSSFYAKIDVDRPKPELEKAIKQAEHLPDDAKLQPNPEDFKNVYLQRGYIDWNKSDFKFHEYLIKRLAILDQADGLGDALAASITQFNKTLDKELLKGRYLFLDKDDIDLQLKEGKLVVIGDNIKEEDKVELAKTLTEDTDIKEAFTMTLNYIKDTYNAIKTMSYISKHGNNKGMQEKSIDSFAGYSFKEMINKIKNNVHLDHSKFSVDVLLDTGLFFIHIPKHGNRIEEWLTEDWV